MLDQLERDLGAARDLLGQLPGGLLHEGGEGVVQRAVVHAPRVQRPGRGSFRAQASLQSGRVCYAAATAGSAGVGAGALGAQPLACRRRASTRRSARARGPSSVSAYSTRGGTSGNVSRATMPSSSSARRRSESVRGEMPSSERSSSQKRARLLGEVADHSSVHLPQTMSAVRQTGQSEFGMRRRILPQGFTN